MSLELLENEIKKKFGTDGSTGITGKSVHEHAGTQLLYPYTVQEIEKPDGSTEIIKEIDVDARTELPNPSGTTVLEHYANWLDTAFPTYGRSLRGDSMRFLNQRYKINMISKDRKGRGEYTQIATGAFVNEKGQQTNIVKEVSKS